MFYASGFSPCVIAFFRTALRRDERRRRDAGIGVLRYRLRA
jgi:hypothetical protein